MSKFIDMTGWKMWEHGVPESRLTVIKRGEDYVDPNGNHRVQWICECNCDKHNIVLVSGCCLRRGTTLSCGCWKKEESFQRMKKYNKYDLTGEYGIGWTTNTNKEFYFDLEDYDKIKDYTWYENIIHGVSLLSTSYKNKTTRMHIILGFKNYDHIDRNELNNRKDNLRKATTQENIMNRGVRRNNISGVTGVVWNKKSKKWLAQIKINKKTIYLGRFTDKNDAIVARLLAEKKYFGEFAPQKHLYQQYGII